MKRIGTIRKKVRQVLALGDPYPLTEEMIIEGVNILIRPPATVSEIREAIEWNVGEDFARSKDNDETEEREWKLTEKGEAKAN